MRDFPILLPFAAAFQSDIPFFDAIAGIFSFSLSGAKVFFLRYPAGYYRAEVHGMDLLASILNGNACTKWFSMF